MVWALLAFFQDSPSLNDAVEAAEKARSLAIVRLVESSAAPEWADPLWIKSREGLPTVTLKLESKVWLGWDIPDLPTLAFLNGQRQPRGFVVGPVSVPLLVKWTNLVREVDRRHEALEFRAKGRLGEKDTALLALSFASRLEVSRAPAFLSTLDLKRPLLETEAAWFALGQAYWIKRQDSLAQEAFGHLRAPRTSDLFRNASRIRYAAIVSKNRPDEAKEELRAVLRSEAVDTIDRDYAQKLLDNLGSLDRAQ